MDLLNQWRWPITLVVLAHLASIVGLAISGQEEIAENLIALLFGGLLILAFLVTFA